MPLSDVSDLSGSSDFSAATPGPLYGRIAALLRQRIRGGRWESDARIPTIDHLMAEFDASRVTVRQALSLLERDGLIARYRGRGTFVTGRAGAADWIRLGRSWRELVEAIDGTAPELLGAEDDVQPPHGEDVTGSPAPSYRCLRRIHRRGGKAFAVMNHYIDAACYAVAPDRFDRELIIPLLQGLPGVEVGRAHQTLTIGSAEPDIAAHLGISLGAPVGMLRRVIHDTGDRAIYVGDLVYRGDLVRMEVDLDIPRGATP